MRLIGLAGYKGSGKDSTYQAIKAVLPDQNVQRVAFADKLKVLAARTLGYIASDDGLISLMDEAKETWEFEISEKDKAGFFTDFSGRDYLQRLGQHARIVFGDEFWVEQVLPDHPEELRKRYAGTDVLCVTDVRCPNEAFRVQQLGGEIWQILRPGTASDGHASEVALPPQLVDVLVNNVGDRDFLKATVKTVLK